VQHEPGSAPGACLTRADEQIRYCFRPCSIVVTVMLDDNDFVVVAMMTPAMIAMTDDDCFLRLGRRSIGHNETERRQSGK
jgi:hypothetical protein